MELEKTGLEEIEQRLAFAKENYGDAEVQDILLEKAGLLAQQHEYDKSIEIYEQAYLKALGISKKLEVVFKILEIHLELKQVGKIKQDIDRCTKLFEDGGDWEKKNKLCVCEGLYALMTRNFKECSAKLIPQISTFNAPELISYNKLVFYTVLTSLVSLKRSEINKQIVHSSEVNSVIPEMPNLKRMLEGYYNCEYKQFLESLVEISQEINEDATLKVHKNFLIKQIRIMIYSQFLESYKTVRLLHMANTFGVSEQFMDRELSELISSGNLFCKIDKVNGIVESVKPDLRMSKYQEAIKLGDRILNKIQKLSSAIEA